MTGMSDRPRHSDSSDDSGAPYDRESTGVPRWLKVAGIVVAIVVLLVVAMMLIGGVGGHGPGRHGMGCVQAAGHDAVRAAQAARAACS